MKPFTANPPSHAARDGKKVMKSDVLYCFDANKADFHVNFVE